MRRFLRRESRVVRVVFRIVPDRLKCGFTQSGGSSRHLPLVDPLRDTLGILPHSLILQPTRFQVGMLRISESVSSVPLPHILVRDYDQVRVCDIKRRTILREVHLHDIVLAGF